jgi:HD-like signal output (HDOD) protein
MAFVGSGQAALERLASKRFDIIVSDMRMPGMDGADLLIQVKKRYPHMVRIILSGHSSQPVVMKSVRPAHQYLAKPCSADKLISVLSRASLLSDFLCNKDLAGLVSQMETLPSLSDTYRELMAELDAEDPSIRRVGEIVSQDMGMTGTVLKLINSAFFGLSRHISSPVEAVMLLGLDVIKGLAVSVKIFTTFEQDEIPGFSFDGLWRHCSNAAGIAKKIAQAEGMDKHFIDEALLGGMLHDLGKLVFASLLPVEYNGVLELVRIRNRPLWEVEHEVLGTTHAEVGAYLMGLWGLSDGIVHALAFHHRPQDSGEKGFSLTSLVYAANCLEHKLCVINKNYAPRELDWTYLAAEGVGDKVPGWLELTKKTLNCEADHE